MTLEQYEDLDSFLQAFPSAEMALIHEEAFPSAVCFILDTMYIWLNPFSLKYVIHVRGLK